MPWTQLLPLTYACYLFSVESGDRPRTPLPARGEDHAEADEGLSTLPGTQLTPGE